MAQTVEEIAEILSEIRAENAHNMKGFDKVLTGIDGVLEKIAEGGQAAETITDYLNDVRSLIEEKHGFEARKLSELELSLKNLLAKQDTLTKSQEVKELFAALASNYNNFSSEVFGQREVIVNIDKKLVEMANDDSDKHQIINSVLAVRQELEDINNSRVEAVENITGSLAEIHKRIIMLDVSDQNDIIKRELENLYVTSNAILSSLQIADQKNDTLVKLFEDTAKSDLKNITDKVNEYGEVVASLKEILAMNAEESNNLFNDKIAQLEQSFERIVTEENFAEFRKELGDFVQTIVDNSNTLHGTLNEYKPEFENILNAIKETDYKDSLDSVHSKLDGITDNLAVNFAGNIQTIKDTVGSLAEEIKTAQEDRSMQNLAAIEFKIGDCVTAVKNAATETDVRLGNSLSEINELKTDIARFLDIVNSATIRQEGRFDVINDTVGTNLEDVKDSLNNIFIRLENLKINYSETSQNNKEVIVEAVEEARIKTENLINNLDASSNMGLETIRTEVGTLIDSLEDVKNEFHNVSGENVDKILSNIDGIGENISLAFADKFSNINEKFEWVSNALTDQINSLKDVVNDYTSDNGISDKLYTINGLITNTAEDYDNKINGLKSDIEGFAQSIEKINTETDLKLGNSVSEITNIKTELTNIMDVLHSASYEENEKLNEITGMISADFNDILAKITYMQDMVQNGLKEDFQNIVTALDEKFENLLSFFEVFKTVYTSDVKDNIVEVSEKVNELGDKISVIKDEIALVNTDLMDAVNSKSEMIMNEFEPLKASVNSVLEFDFSNVISDVKEQIQNTYSNLAADLSSGNTMNSMSFANIENSFNEIITKFDDLEGSVNRTIKGNLDLLQSAVEGIGRSVENVLGQQTNTVNEDWANNIKELEEKISVLSSNYEKSLNLVVKDIRQSLNTIVNAYSEEMKNSISILADNGETLKAIDNLKYELSNKIDAFEEQYNNDAHGEESLSEQLKSFVDETFARHLDTIQKTVREVNEMGTLVDNSGEVISVIEKLRKEMSSEISLRLEKYTADKNKSDVEAKDKIDEMFAAFDEKLNEVKFEVNQFIYDHVVQEEKTKVLDEIMELRKSSFGLAGILRPNLKNVLNKLEEKVALIDSKAPGNEYFTKVLEDHKNELIIELSKISDELGASSRVTESLDTLHQKIDLIVELDDLKSEPINEIQEKTDYLCEESEKLSETVSSIDEKTEMLKGISEGLYFLNEKADKIADISDGMYFVNEKTEKIAEISNVLSTLHDKVDLLAEYAVDDDSYDIKEEFQNIKHAIEAETENKAKDVKNSVIESVVNILDQVNFDEEAGQIKDFVEIKTDEITENLEEVKSTLNRITNPEADYVYSLQDIESDISKLRLMLNEIKDSASAETFDEITSNINNIAESVSGLTETLTQEQIADIKNDFEKLAEDVVSISSRTNQLLLTSDESYKVLTNSLEEFGKIVNNLEERVNYFDNTEISKRIEAKLDGVTSVIKASANNSQVLKEAMIYMGEWIDNTSENIGSITEKTAEIDGIKTTLEELKASMPDNSIIIDRLEQKFEEQQARIDRLERNLDRLITVVEDKDDTRIIKKVDKIERQISKLAANIEKLASYVDEE